MYSYLDKGLFSMKDNNILSLSKYAGEEFDYNVGIRTVYAGKRRATDHREDKNILLLGSSKKENYLLIDGMCNFLYNNEFKNKSRYHIRNEGDEEYDNSGIITRYIFNQAQLSFRPIIYEISPNVEYSVISQVSTILETISQITSLCIVITTKNNDEENFSESIQTILHLFSERSISINISLLILINTGLSYFDTLTLPKSFDRLPLQNKQKYYFNVDAIFSKYIKDFNNIPESSEKLWNITMTNMAGFFHYISTVNSNSNNKNIDLDEGKEIKLTSILSSSCNNINEISSNKIQRNTSKDDIININNNEGNKIEYVNDQLKNLTTGKRKKDSLTSKTSTSTTISSVKSDATTLPKDDFVKEIIIENNKDSFGEISLSPVDKMMHGIGKTTYINGNNDEIQIEGDLFPTSISKYPSVQSLTSQKDSIFTNTTQSTFRNFNQQSNVNEISSLSSKESIGELSKKTSLKGSIFESPKSLMKNPKRQYTPRFGNTPYQYPIPEEDEERNFDLTSNNLSHSISLLSETASIKHIRSIKNSNNFICSDYGSCVFYLIAPLFVIMIFLVIILTIIFLT
uniref:VWFA domain-containing protein n=1 Tax=Strongyloides stercoralis TaxID=6248 RepID=A0A0K0E162_STRER